METGFVILINISSALVIGPIIGGALYGYTDVAKACTGMAIFALAAALIFTVLGFCIPDPY